MPSDSQLETLRRHSNALNILKHKNMEIFMLIDTDFLVNT